MFRRLHFEGFRMREPSSETEASFAISRDTRVRELMFQGGFFKEECSFASNDSRDRRV